MSTPRHDASVPWGHWLSLEPRGVGLSDHFVDENGCGWQSIREAFWIGRLGMPLADGEVPDDQIELVHAIPSSRLSPGSNRVFPDILSDLTTTHLMHSWLASVGLLADDSRHPLKRNLTAEAGSVVRILDLTRPSQTGGSRPCRATIDQLSAALRGDAGSEERRTATEAMAEGWEVAFLRHAIAGRPAVVLARCGDGPFPVMTTVWMLRFPDDRLRDGFYDWLCDRLNRWPIAALPIDAELLVRRRPPACRG